LLAGAWWWGALLAGVLATVFGAVLGAVFEMGVFETGVFETGVFEAEAFEAVFFEPVAFAAVFAVLFGIALLLFFEDLAADALVRPSLREVRARLLVAPRLTAADFLLTLEALFLRVFCDTACARELPRPCSMFFTGTHRGQSGLTGSANVPNIAHFPQKSMICAQGGAFGRQFAGQTGIRVKPKRVPAIAFSRELDTRFA
jgi:hypothetical protein